MLLKDFLKKAREERKLSLRELATLCQPPVSHIYIYQLEIGQKTEPSSKIIKRLVRALKLDSRRSQIFKLLAELEEIPDGLAELFLNKENEILPEEVRILASANFRGHSPKTKEEWLLKLKQVRELVG